MNASTMQAKEAQGVKDLHSNNYVMNNKEKPLYSLRMKLEQPTIGDSFFKVRTAKTRLTESMKLKSPKQLFDCFVVEGEVSVLFAPANVGKSILAMQIADSISRGKSLYGFESELKKGEKVAYVDLENTDHQFAGRYSDTHDFSDNLLMLEVPVEKEYTPEQLISNLKTFLVDNKCKVLIFDNISFLGSLQSANEAMTIVKALRNLRDELGITILILAHTNKKDNKPMTLNDLAGSSKIGNLIDSAFALGRVMGDTGLRYIKQLKSRSGEKKYEDPVMVVELVKDKGLHFEYKDTGLEQSLLKMSKDVDEEEIYRQVWNLHKQGLSCRKIEDELGISKSKVHTIVKVMENRMDKEQ